MIPFKVIDTMREKIFNFMGECGEPYCNPQEINERNIIFALVSGQYIYKPEKYFVSYWFVKPEEVSKIQETLYPVSGITKGSVLFVSEMASKSGTKELVSNMKKICRENNIKGVFWNRHNKGLRNFLNKEF